MLQKEKEKFHKKMHDLVKRLHAKHALELEIEQLKGVFRVMKKLEEVEMKQQEKEEELPF
jgi:hypothetical protein